MKRSSLLLAVALAAPVVLAGPAGAQTQSGQNGEVRMTVHTHSAGTLLFPVDRLSYNFTVGEHFSYSSRLCSGSAPFNDVGLNFIPDYPGVDDNATHAARVRHRFEGTITSTDGNGNGSLQGKLTTVLCQLSNGIWVPSQHVIVSNVTAQLVRISTNDLKVYGGFQFSPTESTGTFRDLTGGGRIEARFTCLGALANPSAPTCAQLGEYTDFVASTGDPTLGPGQLQPGVVGTYYDPTITTGSVSSSA